MPGDSIFLKIILKLLEKIFSVQENKSLELNSPNEILIIRYHNDLYDLLTGVSIFRAIKETFPDSHVSLIIRKFSFPGKLKIKYVDQVYIFNGLKLFNPFYFIKTCKFLRKKYDVALVPVLVSVSHTSNFIARLSNSETRIGTNTINGIKNESYFLFDKRIDIDWRIHPDSNVSERSLDILRPFGINTTDYRSEIDIDDNDLKAADKFLSGFNVKKENIIGLHVGALKPQCRWSLVKFCSLLNKLNENYSINFYLAGSSADINEINFVKKNIKFSVEILTNKTVPEIAAVVSKSDLFISNDSEIMHIAGSTSTPQISIFGFTNPFNWAPVGANKYFIRKSELIDDIAVEDIYHLCELILQKKED